MDLILLPLIRRDVVMPDMLDYIVRWRIVVLDLFVGVWIVIKLGKIMPLI